MITRNTHDEAGTLAHFYPGRRIGNNREDETATIGWRTFIPATGALDSRHLHAALTAPDEWEARILGVSRMARVQVRNSWVLTSNNADLQQELLGRSIRTRLDANMELPGSRNPDDFRHPHVRLYALQNRGELIRAALIMIRSWIAAGRKPWVPPKGKIPLASFEEWSYVIGGILQHVGITGFLDDVLDIYKQSDVNVVQWELFVTAWWETFGDKEVTSRQLYDLIVTKELDFDFGRHREDDAKKKALGVALRNRNGRIIAGKKVTEGSRAQNKSHWRLVLPEGPGPTTSNLSNPTSTTPTPPNAPQECELKDHGDGNDAKTTPNRLDRLDLNGLAGNAPAKVFSGQVPSEGSAGRGYSALTHEHEAPGPTEEGCSAEKSFGRDCAAGPNRSNLSNLSNLPEAVFAPPRSTLLFNSQLCNEIGREWDSWPLHYLTTEEAVREVLPLLQAAPAVGLDEETYAPPEELAADLKEWVKGQEEKRAKEAEEKRAQGKKVRGEPTPTPKEREDILPALRKAIATDVRRGRVRLVQLAVPGAVYVIDATKVDVRLLEPLVCAEKRPVLVGHNITFDLSFLALQYDIWPPDGTHIFDTMGADLLLTASARERVKANGWYGLEQVAQRTCGIALDKEEQKGDWGVPRLSEEQLTYARRDAAALLPLYCAQAAEIEQAEMEMVWQVEMRALCGFMRSGLAGMPLDEDGWVHVTSQMKHAMEKAAAKMDAYAAEHLDMDAWRREISKTVKDPAVQNAVTINWSSPDQVKAAFAVAGKRLKSTGAEVLETLRGHPLADVMLEYREAATRYKMFGLQTAAAIHPLTKRVHPFTKQFWPTSGRVSQEKPSLQLIPQEPAYRRLFHPRDAARCFVVIDYSQIELRVIAVWAEDQAMIDAFKEGRDLHRELMAKITGKRESEITTDERKAAKSFNFGICYYMQAEGVMAACHANGVPCPDIYAAQDIINAYYDMWEGVRAWHRRVERGPRVVDTRTILGRRRLGVTNIPDKLNTPIQGSAADG